MFLNLNVDTNSVSFLGIEPLTPMSTTPSPASYQDAELMRKVAQGDKSAFGYLFDRYSQLALNLAWRVLNEKQEAEDVVQEVFMHLWRNASSYDRQRGNLSTWIVMIARSRSIDKLRSRKARHFFDSNSEGVESLSEQLSDPSNNLKNLENRLLVRKAFGSLPVEQRIAIEMAYYEGMSQSEIADALREPLGTIKTRIRSGLIKLKQVLGTRIGN